MHFLQAINSDISVLIVCSKTGGTIKGDIKKNIFVTEILLKAIILISFNDRHIVNRRGRVRTTYHRGRVRATIVTVLNQEVSPILRECLRL